MNILLYLIIIFSFLGIYITRQISNNKLLKEKGEKTVCLVGHKCDDVIFSDYSSFLGIPLEKMGFAYYLYNIIFYSIYIYNSSAVSELIYFISLGITFGGFLFSIYLTYIQIFKLKALCSWCLSSALSSTLIFIFSYSFTLLYKPEVIEYVQQINIFIRGFESITLIVGVSIYTVIEILTLLYVKDLEITEKEDRTLQTAHQIGWFVIFLLVLNNIGIYLPEYLLGDHSFSSLGNIFYLELISIVVIILNTIVYNIQVFPKVKESLKNNTMHVEKFCMLRKCSILQSLVSLGAWYYLFYINFIV